MKVVGLDGNDYVVNLTKFGQSDNPSSLHIRARKLLKKLFPFDIVYEELTLPGSCTDRQRYSLSADFYIHSKRLMIEVQGEQHYKFNEFFFGSKIEFLKAQYRDSLKVIWCELNSITLIYFPYNESDIDWERRILDRYNDE